MAEASLAMIHRAQRREGLHQSSTQSGLQCAVWCGDAFRKQNLMQLVWNIQLEVVGLLCDKERTLISLRIAFFMHGAKNASATSLSCC